jgi:hypothetical protein
LEELQEKLMDQEWNQQFQASGALDWNESREQSTHHYFKQNIADKFHQFLQQRSKSRFNVTKNIYVSQ